MKTHRLLPAVLLSLLFVSTAGCSVAAYTADLRTQLEAAREQDDGGYIFTGAKARERVDATAIALPGPVDVVVPRGVYKSELVGDEAEIADRYLDDYAAWFRPVSVDLIYGAAGRMRHYLSASEGHFSRVATKVTIDEMQVDVLVEPVLADGTIPENGADYVRLAALFPYKARSAAGRDLLADMSLTAMSPTGQPVSLDMPEMETGGRKVRLAWLSAPNEFHWQLTRDKDSGWEIDGMWFATAVMQVASPSERGSVSALRVTCGITARTSSRLSRYIVRRVSEHVLPVPPARVSAPSE